MKRTIIAFLMVIINVAAFSQQIYKVRVEKLSDGYYESMFGSIKITGEVVNGQRNGTWTETHPSSEVPHFIIQYVDDKKDGLFIEIDRQAYLLKKIEYKDDLIQGTSYEWNKGGRLVRKQDYDNGELDGKTMIYYDNGFLQEESDYNDGKKNGLSIWYSYADKSQGYKVAMYTYQDGMFEGVQETYYENGNIKTQKMFSNNVQHGAAIEYYEDGSIKSEANYKNGELKGRVKEYEMGKKIK